MHTDIGPEAFEFRDEGDGGRVDSRSGASGRDGGEAQKGDDEGLGDHFVLDVLSG